MLETSPSRIAVVVAALNEEKGIGPTLEELQGVLTDSRMVVVDGNSFDKTVEIAKNFGVDVVLQPGTGKGDAMAHGLRQLSPHVRYVVFTDADFTYPAEYVPKMVEVLEHSPEVGMVIGDRFGGLQNLDKSFVNIFSIGNRLIAIVQYFVNRIRLNDPLSGLRVIRADLLNCWTPKSKGFDIEAEINSIIERSGYSIAEIPIDYRKRLGKKKLNLWDGLRILVRIMIERA